MSTQSIVRYLFATASALLCLCRAQAQTEFPPAYNNQAHYAPGDLVTDYGNLYRCNVAVTKPYLDPSKTYKNWELYYVRNNTTITVGVGQTFPDLLTAWTYVRNCHIAEAAYLHLSIVTTGGNLDETFSAPLNLDHTSGAQIAIQGDNASKITLSFPGSNGLVIDSGHSFGTISNVSLVGGTAFSGIYAGTNGSFTYLTNISVNGFDYNVYAEQLGTVIFGDNIEMSNCYNFGCFANTGACISFSPGQLSLTGDSGIGFCLEAVHGARIIAENATVSASGVGVIAAWGGGVDVDGAAITNCHYGCVSYFNGTVEAEGVSLSSNSTYDLQAYDGGVIDALGVTTGSTSVTTGGAIYFT